MNGRTAAILADIDVMGMRRLAAHLTAEGGGALPVPCDVTNADQVKAMVRVTAEEDGGGRVVVKNAGMVRDGALFTMSEAPWQLVHAMRARGAFLPARAVHKCMAQAHWGRILDLPRISALGGRGQVDYSAAEAGLEGLTWNSAVEVGRFGITVNAVTPGFIEMSMPLTAISVISYVGLRAGGRNGIRVGSLPHRPEAEAPRCATTDVLQIPCVTTPLRRRTSSALGLTGRRTKRQETVR